VGVGREEVDPAQVIWPLEPHVALRLHRATRPGRPGGSSAAPAHNDGWVADPYEAQAA